MLEFDELQKRLGGGPDGTTYGNEVPFPNGTMPISTTWRESHDQYRDCSTSRTIHWLTPLSYKELERITEEENEESLCSELETSLRECLSVIVRANLLLADGSLVGVISVGGSEYIKMFKASLPRFLRSVDHLLVITSDPHLFNFKCDQLSVVEAQVKGRAMMNMRLLPLLAARRYQQATGEALTLKFLVSGANLYAAGFNAHDYVKTFNTMVPETWAPTSLVHTSQPYPINGGFTIFSPKWDGFNKYVNAVYGLINGPLNNVYGPDEVLLYYFEHNILVLPGAYCNYSRTVYDASFKTNGLARYVLVDEKGEKKYWRPCTLSVACHRLVVNAPMTVKWSSDPEAAVVKIDNIPWRSVWGDSPAKGSEEISTRLRERELDVWLEKDTVTSAIVSQPSRNKSSHGVSEWLRGLTFLAAENSTESKFASELPFFPQNLPAFEIRKKNMGPSKLPFPFRHTRSSWNRTTVLGSMFARGDYKKKITYRPGITPYRNTDHPSGKVHGLTTECEELLNKIVKCEVPLGGKFLEEIDRLTPELNYFWSKAPKRVVVIAVSGQDYYDHLIKGVSQITKQLGHVLLLADQHAHAHVELSVNPDVTIIEHRLSGRETMNLRLIAFLTVPKNQNFMISGANVISSYTDLTFHWEAFEGIESDGAPTTVYDICSPYPICGSLIFSSGNWERLPEFRRTLLAFMSTDLVREYGPDEVLYYAFPHNIVLLPGASNPWGRFVPDWSVRGDMRIYRPDTSGNLWLTHTCVMTTGAWDTFIRTGRALNPLSHDAESRADVFQREHPVQTEGYSEPATNLPVTIILNKLGFHKIVLALGLVFLGFAWSPTSSYGQIILAGCLRLLAILNLLAMFMRYLSLEPAYPDFRNQKLQILENFRFSNANKERLVIGGLGSRGDWVVSRAYARLSLALGIPTDYVEQRATPAQMMDIENGKFTSFFADFIDVAAGCTAGYKATFLPAVDEDDKTDSYRLNFGEEFAEKFHLATPEGKQTWLQKIANFYLENYHATFRINNLDGNLPTSYDGHSFTQDLEEPVEPGSGDIYVNGSSETKIPGRNYLEGPYTPYDLKRYRNGHCHGGVGTGQTMIKMGLIAHSYGTNMDRVWKRPLRPSDFKRKSITLFIGMLVSKGFQVPYPFWFTQYAHFKYKVAKMFVPVVVARNLATLLKIMFFMTRMPSFLSYVVMPIMSFPTLALWIYRLAIPRRVLSSVCYLFWMRPFLYDHLSLNNVVFALWTLIDMSRAVIREFHHASAPVRFLRIHRVEAMPFPYGHCQLVDSEAGILWQGEYTSKNRGLNAWFALNQAKLDKIVGAVDIKAPQLEKLLCGGTIVLIGIFSLILSSISGVLGMIFFSFGIPFMSLCGAVIASPTQCDTITLPVPGEFTINSITKDGKITMKTGSLGPYGHMHNCQTMAFEHLPSEGFIARLVMAYMLLFTEQMFGFATILNICREILGFEIANNKMEGLGNLADQVEAPLVEIVSELGSISHDEYLGHCQAVGHKVFEHCSMCEKTSIKPPELPDTSQEEVSLEGLVQELGLIGTMLLDYGAEKEDVLEVLMRVLQQTLEKTPVPDSFLKMNKETDRILDECLNWGDVPHSEGPYTRFMFWLDKILSKFYHIPVIADFISWARNLGRNWLKFLKPLTDMLFVVGKIVWGACWRTWLFVWAAIGTLMDAYYGGKRANRPKAVWSLSNLVRSPFLSVKMQLEASLAHANYEGRGALVEDYERFCRQVQDKAKELNLGEIKMGGPQHRRYNIKNPALTQNLRDLLRPIEDETGVHLDYPKLEYMEAYNRDVEQYIKEGIPQGIDGVILDHIDNRHSTYSVSRYGAIYPETDQEDLMLAEMTAEEMVRRWPEIYDMKMVPFQVAMNNMKETFSPGAFFEGHYKSRQALYKAGYDKIMLSQVLENFQQGRYPTQWYHAFPKAQVVSIEPMLRKDRPKPVRTVTAQFLLGQVTDGMLFLSRNKIISWEKTGFCAGMPLNQTLATLLQGIRENIRQSGGIFAEADAHEMDSRTKKTQFHLLSTLGRLGMKGSSNEEGYASFVKAKYDAESQKWIMSLTEPEWDHIAYVVPNSEIREELSKSNEKFCTPNSPLFKGSYVLFESESEWETFKEKNPKITAHWSYKGVAALTSEYDLKKVVKGFQHRIINLFDTKMDLVDELRVNQATTYTSNIYPGNRGGATGKHSTSADNTHAFRGTLAMTFYRYYKGQIPMREIFDRLGASSQGDDTALSFQTVRDRNGRAEKLDVDEIKRISAGLGCHLDFDIRESIYDVLFLGKRLQHIDKLDSSTTWASVKETLALYKRDHPHNGNVTEVIIQDTTAMIRRRTSQRWYQAEFGHDHNEPTLSSAMKFAEHEARKVMKEKGFVPTDSNWHKSFEKQVIHEIEQLTSRGDPTIFKPRVPFNTYSFNRCATLVGHGLLCAFIPEEWARCASEYCQQMNRLGHAAQIPVQWKIHGDEDGLPVVVMNPKTRDSPHEAPQNLVDKEMRKTSGHSLTLKQKAFLDWAKRTKFPRYKDVVKIHMKTPMGAEDRYDKWLRKVSKKNAWPFDEAIRFGCDMYLDWLHDIPRQWHKMIPNMASLHPEPVFQTSHMYIEWFVFLSNRPTELGGFESRIRESPYGVVCDSRRFWQLYNTNQEFREWGENIGVEAFQTMAILNAIAYASLYPFEKWITRIPIVGVLWRLFTLVLVDFPKLYSVLGIWSYLATGHADRTLAGLMPKDPYMWIKRASASFVDKLPIELFGLIPLGWFIQWLPPAIHELAEWFRQSKAISAWPTGENGGASANPWIAPYHEMDCQADLREDKTKPYVSYVKAPTSTGKTKLLYAAMMNPGTRKNRGGRNASVYRHERVWIICPFIVLRDDFEPGPFGDYKVQKLVKNLPIDPVASILVCTYGHFLTRLSEIQSGDAILLDEIHKVTDRMIITVDKLLNVRKWKDNGITADARCLKILFLSATPPEKPYDYHGVPVEFNDFETNGMIRRRFTTNVVKMDTDVVSMMDHAHRQHGDLVQRSLVVVPHITEIPGIIEQIQNLPGLKSIKVTEVSSNNRTIPKEGIIIATPMVDNGLDINPPVNFVFSSGRARCFHRGQEIMDGRKASPTDIATQLQRRGRCGRNADGWSYEPACEGMGRIPIPYGAPVSFTEAAVANYCEVPRLLEFPNFSRTRKAVIGVNAMTTEEEQIVVQSDPTVPSLPFFKIMNGDQEEQNGQAILVTLWLAGVESNDLMKTWDKVIVNRRQLPEEYDHIAPIVDKLLLNPVAPFKRCLDLVSQQGVVYLLGDPENPIFIRSSFIRPVEHRWVSEAETKRTTYHTVNNGKGKTSELVQEMQAQIEELQTQILTETGSLINLPDMKSTEMKMREQQMTALRKSFLVHFCSCGSQKNPTFAYCSQCTKRAVTDRKKVRSSQHLMRIVHGHALGAGQRLKISSATL